MNVVLIGIGAYVLASLLIGLLVSRGIRSETDYLIAGRRIGLALATFSMFATWFGAESCISAAGKFYKEGLVGGTTDPFGYTVALLLVGLVFAAPLWKRGLTTLADLFAQRYGRGVERFAALIMAPTSLFWAAAQIRAFGQVLHASSNLEFTVCLALAAGTVILYTCAGGLLADVVTDLIQGVAIVLGLVLILGAIVASSDVNLVQAWGAVEPDKLRLFGGPERPRLEVLELWALTIGGSVVAQELVSRVLGAKSPAVARNGALLGGGLYLAVGLIPAFLGLIGSQLLPGLGDPEQFLPRLAEKFLPTFAYILFVGALVSAILSTVDSTLLAASSLVAHNVVLSVWPGLSERQKLRLARLGVVLFGLIAFGLARGAETIFELVQQANGVGSSGILVLLVLGLFSRWGGARAAAATLVVGLASWAWGTYVAGWTCTYLTSLGCSATTYLAAGWWETRRTRLEANAG